MGNKGQFARKYSVNHNVFTDMDNRHYWLIGLLASDGNVRNDRVFTLTQAGLVGKDMLEYVNTLLSNETPVSFSDNYGEGAYTMYANSIKIVKDLERYNIVPRKTLTYNLPESVKGKYFKDFIRGYIDGDGSVGVYEVGNSKNFLIISFVGTFEFIQACFSEIPIKGKIRKHSNSSVYEIRWTGDNARKFGEWVFESDNVYKSKKFYIFNDHISTHVSRREKYDKIREQVRNGLSNGVSVEKLAEQVGVAWQTIYAWKKKGIV